MNPTKLTIILISVFVLVIGYDIYNWITSKSFSRPEIRLTRLRSTINLVVFLIGASLSLMALNFKVNIFDYRRPIEYSDIKSITFKDFKGFKLPNETFKGTKRFAFISTSIAWEKRANEIEIKTLFHPSRSFTYNEKLTNNFLLQHELYHFHITEYYARLSRKELSLLETIPSENTLKNILKKNSALMDKMQMEYDYETYHSYILKEQKRWQNKLDSLLNLNTDYALTIIKF
jgi:hypothetical protein